MATKQNQTSTKLSDDSPLYQKCLSILVGMKQVRTELAEEASAIQVANPNVRFATGYGERMALIETLDAGYSLMIHEMQRTAKSAGLSLPRELR